MLFQHYIEELKLKEMANQCNFCSVEIPDTEVLCDDCFNSRYMIEKYITREELEKGIDETNPLFYDMDDKGDEET